MSALLNIGCGATFHPDWINLDGAPASPAVRAHDLTDPLPFPDGHFRAVYASHVLEHFDPESGLRLLHECHRVLQAGGTARIAVPDLEAIAKAYLQCLDAADGSGEAEARYDWMMLELYDQTVRTASGGRMGAVLAAPHDEAQRRFIAARVGEQAMAGGSGGSEPAMRRIAAAGASLLLGEKRASAIREGLFRASGEVHRWMYDRFSLARALRTTGFVDVAARAADESAIKGFSGYGLETANGKPRKPDSLYVEGRKHA